MSEVRATPFRPSVAEAAQRELTTPPGVVELEVTGGGGAAPSAPGSWPRCRAAIASA